MAVTSSPFAAADSNRKALVITAPAAARVTISSEGTAVLDQGLTLRTGTAPVILDAWEHGDWVQKALTCIGGGAETLGVIEVYDFPGTSPEEEARAG